MVKLFCSLGLFEFMVSEECLDFVDCVDQLYFGFVGLFDLWLVNI
jgi:hypothetical protein